MYNTADEAPGSCSFQISFADSYPDPSCFPISSSLFKHPVFTLQKMGLPGPIPYDPSPQIHKEANDLFEVGFPACFPVSLEQNQSF